MFFNVVWAYDSKFIILIFILMNRDIEFYQKKVKELQQQNQQLRQQLGNTSRRVQHVSPMAILQLQTKNQKLERHAYNLEKSIKQDLSMYLSDTCVHGECYYRHRYGHLLNQPKNHYKVYY